MGCARETIPETHEAEEEMGTGSAAQRRCLSPFPPQRPAPAREMGTGTRPPSGATNPELHQAGSQSPFPYGVCNARENRSKAALGIGRDQNEDGIRLIACAISLFPDTVFISSLRVFLPDRQELLAGHDGE